MPQKTIDLKIDGMHCAACAAGIEKGLGKLAGINGAQVNYATGSAFVEFEPSLIDESKIFREISDLGYSPQKKKALFSPVDRESPEARKKFLTALVFALPVIALSMGDMLFGSELLPPKIKGIVLLILTLPVMFYAGRGIFSDAWHQLLHFRANMNSLIALGSLAAFIYSTVRLIGILITDEAAVVDYYFETSAAIIILILFGRYLESRSKDKARDAIGALLRLRPGRATAVIDNVETEIDIEEVKAGMILAVKPGEKIPADGTITKGVPSVNESMVTGESVPVEKSAGDKVIGGSINGNSSFRFKVTGTGENTFLANIVRLVSEAQNKKAPVQRLADKIAGIFVPIVLLIAVVTLAAWFIFDRTSPLLLTAPVAVLIIACPCALGLATPTAILAGTGRAARRGIFIRGGDILEEAVKATHIVFDKTGTLTEGRFSVVGMHPIDEDNEEKMLQLAASAESGSRHPLALAIKEKAIERNPELLPGGDVEEFPGFGLKAEVGGRQVLVGNAATMQKNSIAVESLKEAAGGEMARGRTVVYVAVENEVLGFISLADNIREEAPGVLSSINQSGREIIILTGDNHQTAAGVAASIGVGKFEAEVKPDQKSLIIDTYRRAGNKVMMIGDGINDAPALAAADIGVAMGSGTDVAIESADIILVKSDLGSLLEALKISEMTYGTIRQNLFWAFFYNIIAIPLAAGLFYPLFGWSLSPVIAAGAMAFSSLFVVTNSLRLLKVDLK